MRVAKNVRGWFGSLLAAVFVVMPIGAVQGQVFVTLPTYGAIVGINFDGTGAAGIGGLKFPYYPAIVGNDILQEVRAPALSASTPLRVPR